MPHSLTFWELNGFFLLRSSFFRTTRQLASSEVMTYFRPVPGWTDGIPERDQRPRDNRYKFVFTNSWLVRQRHRSWIKGLGKNPQKAVNLFIAYSAFCPGPPNRDPRDGVYTRQPPWWHAMHGVFTNLPAKTHTNRNACIDTLRSVALK